MNTYSVWTFLSPKNIFGRSVWSLFWAKSRSLKFDAPIKAPSSISLIRFWRRSLPMYQHTKIKMNVFRSIYLQFFQIWKPFKYSIVLNFSNFIVAEPSKWMQNESKVSSRLGELWFKVKVLQIGGEQRNVIWYFLNVFLRAVNNGSLTSTASWTLFVNNTLARVFCSKFFRA